MARNKSGYWDKPVPRPGQFSDSILIRVGNCPENP